MDTGITKENLLRIVPPALTHDPAMMARAAADAEALTARLAEIDQVRVISNIDGLNETVLDILARDFKVDWWDADCTLEQKRRMLKSSWRVHKVMGTKAAVEAAASAVYPYARVQEWYEYGGKPYWFRLDVDMPEDVWTPERHKRLMWQLQYYKNLRSHLDKVIYRLPIIVLKNQPGSFRFQRLSFLVPIQAFQPIWEWEQVRFPFLIREELRRPGAVVQWNFQLGKETAGLDPEEVVWQSLRILLRARSYGWDVIQLDGSHRLDGGWLLNQHFRGMAWDWVRFTFAIREQERAGGGAVYSSGAASTRERTQLAGFQVRSGLSETPEKARPWRVEIRGSFRESNTLSGTLTRDTMWYLNGEYRMDGTRKLNAHIIKEEI